MSIMSNASFRSGRWLKFRAFVRLVLYVLGRKPRVQLTPWLFHTSTLVALLGLANHWCCDDSWSMVFEG